MTIGEIISCDNSYTSILLRVLMVDQKRDCMPEFPNKWVPELDNYNHDDARAYVFDCICKKCFISGEFVSIRICEDGEGIVLLSRTSGAYRKKYFYIDDILMDHPEFEYKYTDPDDDTVTHYIFAVPCGFKAIINRCSKLSYDINVGFAKFIEMMRNVTNEDIERDSTINYIIRVFNSILNREMPPSKSEMD